MVHFIVIEILKQKTEVKIGINISNRGDCVKLSNAILEVTDRELSYNTLRRLYRVVDGGKPSDKTLDILSQFNGYKNYQHFIDSFPYENSLKHQFESFHLLSKPNPIELINFIIHLKKISKNFTTILIQIIRELFYQENFQLINKIFNLDILKINNYTYDEVLQIGNSIGFIFRTKTTTTDKITILIGNRNFQDMILTVFVDYTALNFYYGNWIKKLLNIEKRPLIEVFCKCVLNLKNYLNNKEIEYKEISYKKQFHPILIGRVVSQKMLDNNPAIFNDLVTISKLATNVSNFNIQYYYEIILTALCCKRFDIMSHIIKQFSKIRNFDYHYSIHHYAQFYLMCSIYYYKKKDVENYKSFRKRINEDQLRLGYKNTLMVILCILKFHTNKNEQDKTLKLYNEYSSLLDLKRLNHSFLIHYFD